MESKIEEEKEIPEDLKCIICLDLFVSPVVLTCGHSFCRVCVEDLIRQKPTCPVCHTPTLFGVSNLLPNYALKNLIERDFQDHLQKRLSSESDLRQEAPKREAPVDPGTMTLVYLPCKSLSYPLFPGSATELKLDIPLPRDLLPIICPTKTLVMGPSLTNDDGVSLNSILNIQNTVEQSGMITKLRVQSVGRARIVSHKAINVLENEELAKKVAGSEKATFIVDIIGVVNFKDVDNEFSNRQKVTSDVTFVKTMVNHFLQLANSNQPSSYIELRNTYPVSYYQEHNAQLTPSYVSNFSMTTAALINFRRDDHKELYLLNCSEKRLDRVARHMRTVPLDVDPSSLFNFSPGGKDEAVELVRWLAVVAMLLAIVGGLIYRLVLS